MRMPIQIRSVRVKRNLAFLRAVSAVWILMAHRDALNGEFGYSRTIWRPSGSGVAVGGRVSHVLECELERS